MSITSGFTPLPQELLELVECLTDSPRPDGIPIAYLITFNGYGTHLRGHQSGSVDRQHNLFGSPCLPPCNNRIAGMRRRLRWEPFALDRESRRIVRLALIDACTHRNWIPLAVHVRSTHVHSVVHALAGADLVLARLKDRATRTLNLRFGQQHDYWADKGSRKYLWNPDEVCAALRYVLFEQGVPMEWHVGAGSIIWAK